MKYIVDIKGEIEGDFEIICKYEEAPKGDLISREALRKSVTDELERLKDILYKYGEYYSATNQNFKTVLDLIDNAPAVFDDKAYSDGYTQGSCDCEHAHERPQGEWKFSQGVTTQGSLKCPFCDYRDYHNTNSNYCPNCGAKMKGGAE